MRTPGQARDVTWATGTRGRALPGCGRPGSRGERLLQEGIGRLADPGVQLVALAVPRHVDDADVGVRGGHPVGQLDAAHVRHDDVGEDEVDTVIGALEHRERLPAVAGLEHGIAVLRQHARRQRADRVLVLDQEHGFGPADRRRRPEHHLTRVLVGQDPGEAELEARPLPRRAVHPDVPAALHHDAVDRGEAEAGVERRGLGGEERLEQVGLRLGGHALAGVAHDHQDIGTGGDLHPELAVGGIPRGNQGPWSQGSAARRPSSRRGRSASGS